MQQQKTVTTFLPATTHSKLLEIQRYLRKVDGENHTLGRAVLPYCVEKAHSILFGQKPKAKKIKRAEILSSNNEIKALIEKTNSLEEGFMSTLEIIALLKKEKQTSLSTNALNIILQDLGYKKHRNRKTEKRGFLAKRKINN